ncbi:MAG TPA: hypothetical protein DCM44_02885 [Pantoea sp.]|uniref:hypothetical protein n=1 Tax=Pantoea TaxID=53335 RepID=UPI0005349794|nr:MULTISPECIES: hypothetical protein [Pantoea]MDU6389469.1 hypothetical protein [Pantoea sp.]PNK63403.1 hypothetical protein A6J33_011800 [Pantoea sp. FDAARGOS_194]HAK33850.1 hypothetical protein [Pantoea sp.]
MSSHATLKALSAKQIKAAANALRWAAFGGRRGPDFTYYQASPDRLHFETEYDGRKAWVDLDIPYTPLSLLIAGSLLLQQLNTYVG